jgi:WD40 repeat protein
VIGGLSNGRISYYNLSTDTSSSFPGHNSNSKVNCLKRLDNDTYASGSDDNKVIIRNSKTGGIIKILSGHSDYVLCLELLGNGFLASGGKDANIFIWNYTSSSLNYSFALINAHKNQKKVNFIKQLSGYYFATATNGASNNLKVTFLSI